MKNKQWIKFKAIFVMCIMLILYPFTIILPLMDIFNLYHDDFTFVGQIINRSKYKISADIRIMEYQQEYEIQLKYFFSWEKHERISKEDKYIQKPILSYVGERYIDTLNNQTRKLERGKKITVIEQTNLYKTLMDDSNE